MELLVIVGIIIVFALMAIRKTKGKADGTMTKRMSDMTKRILNKKHNNNQKTI